VAVEAFLGGRIGFRDIHRIIDKTMQRHGAMRPKEIGEVLSVDAWAREAASSLVNRMNSRRG
jgi:1-deoxy-D-xylulose-5-phosphate reductoisomerase